MPGAADEPTTARDTTEAPALRPTIARHALAAAAA